jgi:hypothetical protein
MAMTEQEWLACCDPPSTERAVLLGQLGVAPCEHGVVKGEGTIVAGVLE